MKFLFILICAVHLPFSLFSQELDLNYRFGIPTKYLSIESTTNNGYQKSSANRMRSRFDSGLYFGYSHEIWKRIGLHATGGIEFSRETLYLPIVDPDGVYLEGVPISNGRFTYHLGIKKRFKIWEDRLFIDLGLRVVDRFPYRYEQNYSSDYKFSDRDWIEYKYDIDTYHGDYRVNDNIVENAIYTDLNAQLNLDVCFKLNQYLRLNVNTNYTRNNYFFYNYTYSARYYYNGSPTPTAIVEFQGIQGADFGVRNHYIYTEIGLKWTF